MTDTKTPDVVVTQPFAGLCHMQVCAHKDVPTDVVEAEANRQNMAGTTGGWFIMIPGSEHVGEDDGNMLPVVCGDDPDRLHYMLVC